MPTYEVTKDGVTLEITGPKPPTKEQLDRMFAQVRPPNFKTVNEPPPDEWIEGFKDVGHLAIGAAKGLGGSLYNVGQFASKVVPGIPDLPDTTMFEGTNTPQKIGRFVEQAAEFLAPAGVVSKAARAAAALGPKAKLAARIVGEAVGAGTVTAAQGGNPVVGAAAGASAPVAGRGLTTIGEYIGSKGIPFVRAAIKPTVTAMKQQAGASRTGIDAQANRLAKFILDNRLTSPEKAQAVVEGAERELRQVLAVHNPVTQAPKRVMRYLAALEQSAKRQALPADDVATIRAAAKELLEQSDLAEDVTATVMRPSSSGLVDASGRPVLVPERVTTRALREDVTASEALDKARATSQWSTRRSYGEQKGAAKEASKAAERGLRDEVKERVPQAKPLLTRQGQGIQARETLDRMAHRAANRDVVSLPAHVIAAGEVASGRMPIMAFAANWLRNNQLKAGIYADALAAAIRKNNVQQVTEILGRLGVGATAQIPKPLPAQ